MTPVCYIDMQEKTTELSRKEYVKPFNTIIMNTKTTLESTISFNVADNISKEVKNRERYTPHRSSGELEKVLNDPELNRILKDKGYPDRVIESVLTYRWYEQIYYENTRTSIIEIIANHPEYNTTCDKSPETTLVLVMEGCNMRQRATKEYQNKLEGFMKYYQYTLMNVGVFYHPDSIPNKDFLKKVLSDGGYSRLERTIILTVLNDAIEFGLCISPRFKDLSYEGVIKQIAKEKRNEIYLFDPNYKEEMIRVNLERMTINLGSWKEKYPLPYSLEEL